MDAEVAAPMRKEWLEYWFAGIPDMTRIDLRCFLENGFGNFCELKIEKWTGKAEEGWVD